MNLKQYKNRYNYKLPKNLFINFKLKNKRTTPKGINAKRIYQRIVSQFRLIDSHFYNPPIIHFSVNDSNLPEVELKEPIITIFETK